MLSNCSGIPRWQYNSQQEAYQIFAKGRLELDFPSDQQLNITCQWVPCWRQDTPKHDIRELHPMEFDCL